MNQRTVIEEIEGQLCWGAWQGYGSVLFFDFGEPAVYVSNNVSVRTGRLAAVEGTWSLCVDAATWRIGVAGELLADSQSSDRKVAKALHWIRGQVFLGASRARGAHILDFDLGGRIEMRPYRDPLAWPPAETCVWYARRRGDDVTQQWFADGSMRFER